LPFKCNLQRYTGVAGAGAGGFGGSFGGSILSCYVGRPPRPPGGGVGAGVGGGVEDGVPLNFDVEGRAHLPGWGGTTLTLTPNP
jgi:hypothetical protein